MGTKVEYRRTTILQAVRLQELLDVLLEMQDDLAVPRDSVPSAGSTVNRPVPSDSQCQPVSSR